MNIKYRLLCKSTGRVEIVLEEEKENALTLLMNHYHPVSVKFNPKFIIRSIRHLVYEYPFQIFAFTGYSFL